MKKTIFFISIYILSTGVLYSEEENSRSNEISFLDEIVVVATGDKEKVRSAASSIAVLSKDEIERYQIKSPYELSLFIPGVLFPKIARSIQLTPSVRGIGDNRVKVLIDNVPLAESFTFSHRAQIGTVYSDIGDLEQVEVLSGGSSNLYGSNAVGGVILLKTVSPFSFLSGKNTKIAINTRYNSSNKSFYLFPQIASRFGKKGAFFIGISGERYKETDNKGEIDTNDTSRTLPDPLNGKNLTSYLKFDFISSNKGVVNVSINTFSSKEKIDLLSNRELIDIAKIADLPPGTVYTVERRNVIGNDSQTEEKVGVSWLYLLGDTELETDLYYRNSRTTQITDELRVTRFGGSIFSAVNTTEVDRETIFKFSDRIVGLRVKVAKDIGGHQFVIGGDFNENIFDMWRDRLDINRQTGELLPPGDLIFPAKYFPRSSVKGYGLYVQDVSSLFNSKLKLVVGARYDVQSLSPLKDEVFENSNLGKIVPVSKRSSFLSPRIGLSYAINNKATIYSNVSRGIRLPSYSAVNSGFVHSKFKVIRLPNPDLKAERSLTYDLGFRLDIVGFAVSLSLFRTAAEDFIELRAVGVNQDTGFLEFKNVNLSNLIIEGVELQFANDYKNFFTKGYFLYSRGRDNEGFSPLSLEPPRGILSFGYRNNTFSTTVQTLFSLKKENVKTSEDFVPFTPDSYVIFNLYSTFRINNKLGLNFGVFNVTDQKYWPWWQIRGLDARDDTIDRYSGAGRYFSVYLKVKK